MGNTCGILPPRNDIHFIHDTEELPPCLLCRTHQGPHLLRRRDGCYFIWKPDEMYCGDIDICSCLYDGGPIECFFYEEIPAQEAERMIEASFTER